MKPARKEKVSGVKDIFRNNHYWKSTGYKVLIRFNNKDTWYNEFKNEYGHYGYFN